MHLARHLGPVNFALVLAITASLLAPGHALAADTGLQIQDLQGKQITKEQLFGAVESVKAASDLYSPVTGEVVEINEELPDSPEEINQDPYVRGWMIIVRMEDPSELDELSSAEQYEELIREV